MFLIVSYVDYFFHDRNIAWLMLSIIETEPSLGPRVFDRCEIVFTNLLNSWYENNLAAVSHLAFGQYFIKFLGIIIQLKWEEIYLPIFPKFLMINSQIHSNLHLILHYIFSKFLLVVICLVFYFSTPKIITRVISQR